MRQLRGSGAVKPNPAFAGLIILAGIIASLHIYFAPTSLFDTIVILGLLAGGIGLVARSLRET